MGICRSRQSAGPRAADSKDGAGRMLTARWVRITVQGAMAIVIAVGLASVTVASAVDVTIVK